MARLELIAEVVLRELVTLILLAVQEPWKIRGMAVDFGGSNCATRAIEKPCFRNKQDMRLARWLNTCAGCSFPSSEFELDVEYLDTLDG